ncbi:hypothetical protein BWQ96_05829 [Gracilariopsis chorda]|uniref:Uncharacterized protein n=1 Tax=Gracilariopsis chorda TaxID=448386 RepID=A0A2V3IQL1_9FLOR|nr:hypothetical protein BWQ96_05829 [Gracilariopsis chorda]|eukprot:PXF44386.1 hypothetical protein BWQ96_05829 [Gracilariopsis chorda]
MAQDESKVTERRSGATPPVSSSRQQNDSQRSTRSPQQTRSVRQDRAVPEISEPSTPCSPRPRARATRETISGAKSTPENRSRGVEQNRVPWNHPSPIPGYPAPTGANPYSRLESSALPPSAIESEPNALPLPPNTHYQASVNLYESPSLTVPYANMGTGARPASQNTPLPPSEYYTPSAATPSGFNNTHWSSQEPSLGNPQESSISTYQDTLSHGQLSPSPLQRPQTPMYLPKPCAPLTPQQEPPRAQNKKPAIDAPLYHRPSAYPAPAYPSSGENQSFSSSQDTRPQPTFLHSQRPMYDSQPGPPAYDTIAPTRPSESNGKLPFSNSSSAFQYPPYPPQDDTSSKSSEDSSEDRNQLKPHMTSVKLPMYTPEPYTPTSSPSVDQDQYQVQSHKPDSTSYSSPQTPTYGQHPTPLPGDPVPTQQVLGNQGLVPPLHSNLPIQGVGYGSQRPNTNPSVRYSSKPEDSLADDNSLSIPEPPVYGSNAYPSGNYVSTAQQSQGHQSSQSQPQPPSIPPPPPHNIPEGYPGGDDNDMIQKQWEYQNLRPPSQSAPLSHAPGYETRPFVSGGAIDSSKISARPGGIQGSTRPPIAPASSQNPGASTDTKLPMSTPFTPLLSTPQSYPGSSSFQTPTQSHYQTVQSGKLPPISQYDVTEQLINQGLQGTPKPAKQTGSTYITPPVTQPQLSYCLPSTPQIYSSVGKPNLHPPPTVQSQIQQHTQFPQEDAHALQSYVQQPGFGPHQNQGTPGMYASPNAMNVPYYKNLAGQQQVFPSYTRPAGNVSYSPGQGQPQYPLNVTAMNPTHVASQSQAACPFPNNEVQGVPVMPHVSDSTPGFGDMNPPKIPFSVSTFPARPPGPNMSQFVQASPYQGGIVGPPVYAVPDQYAAAAANVRPMPPPHPSQNYNSLPPGQSGYTSFQTQGNGLHNHTNALGYTIASGPPNGLRPDGAVESLSSYGFPGNGLGNPVLMPQQTMAPAGTQLSGTNAYQLSAAPSGYVQQVPNGRWNSGAGSLATPSQAGELYEHFKKMVYINNPSKM